MQNDYSNKPGQAQAASDKAGEFTRSVGQQIEQKSKDIADDAQKMLKEGQEQAGKILQTVDKKVRDNPWPVVAGVGVGAFLLGCLIGRSK